MLAFTPNQFYKASRRNRPILLAEGDSWFSYWPQRGYSDNSLLRAVDSLAFFDIVSFAKPGDTIRNMSSLSNLSYINDRLYLINKEDIIGFYISGGGNDLFDNLKYFVNSKGIDESAFTPFLEHLQRCFKHFITAFSRLGVPFYINTYDAPYPSGIGYTKWFTHCGPWLWPVFKQYFNKEQAYNLTKELINRFFEMLVALQVDLKGLAEIKIIDLRGITTKDDYENEVHLNSVGLNKCAEKIIKDIENNIYDNFR